MKKSITLAIAIILLLVRLADADLIFEVDSQTFTQDSGVQTLSLLASSSGGDTTTALTDLTLQFVTSASEFAATPGVFGAPGMVGASNFEDSSSFTRGPADFLSTLNLQFKTAQTLPTSAQTIAHFNIDTSAYAPGTYTVNFTIAPVSSPLPSESFSTTGGSFTIQAVPEPSGFVGIAAVAGLGAFRRRRR